MGGQRKLLVWVVVVVVATVGLLFVVGPWGGSSESPEDAKMKKPREESPTPRPAPGGGLGGSSTDT